MVYIYIHLLIYHTYATIWGGYTLYELKLYASVTQIYYAHCYISSSNASNSFTNKYKQLKYNILLL